MTEKIAPGTRIDDRYVTLRRLGSGGFGEVWLATDESAGALGRQVALKVLHPRVLEIGAVVRERFEQEAELLARLDHPSIVRPLAFSMTESRAYLAMEYVDGVPLARVLKQCSQRDEQLDATEAERVFDELCSAVHYIHEQGVVHRDLKPSNVMFVRRGGRAYVKLLDLGVARILTPTGRDATTVGRIVGSLHYASPEQVRGDRADVRSDVFGLGAILFELITAARAFIVDAGGRPAPAYKPPLRLASNALPRVTGRILGGPRPKPSDAREGLPLALDDVVARALAIDPAERYASAEELADAARPLLRELGGARGTTIYAVISQIVDVSPDPAATDPEPTPLLANLDATATNPLDTPDMLDAQMASVVRDAPGPAGPWIMAAGALAVAAGVAFAVWPRGADVEADATAPAMATGVADVPDAPRVAPRGRGAEAGANRAGGGSTAERSRGGGTPDSKSEVSADAPASGAGGDARANGAAANGARANGARGDGRTSGAPVNGERGDRSTNSAGHEARGGPAERARFPEVDRALSAARAAPNDLPRVAALGDALRRAARSLPDGTARTRLLRRIEASEMRADVEGLAACARTLESIE
ncbi:MAG: serine/threonine-protein kinase [Deltaproteobacteria bacterium]